jgi:hypothetical protein
VPKARLAELQEVLPGGAFVFPVERADAVEGTARARGPSKTTSTLPGQDRLNRSLQRLCPRFDRAPRLLIRSKCFLEANPKREDSYARRSSNNPPDVAVHKGRSRAEIPTRAQVSKKPRDEGAGLLIKLEESVADLGTPQDELDGL